MLEHPVTLSLISLVELLFEPLQLFFQQRDLRFEHSGAIQSWRLRHVHRRLIYMHRPGKQMRVAGFLLAWPARQLEVRKRAAAESARR